MFLLKKKRHKSFLIGKSYQLHVAAVLIVNYQRCSGFYLIGAPILGDISVLLVFIIK